MIKLVQNQGPPDPEGVASPVDPTAATNLGTSTEFLYTGSNPIQSGVTPGTIEAERVAVLRGKVLGRDGNPLIGVKISVLNHPEYGQTQSRTDGMFDMAVNGGSYLTLRYQKDGFLTAQRQTQAPWQEFVWLPDVVMVPFDSQVSTIDLTSLDPIQIARGSVVVDGAGARQATLLFRAGTTATLVKANGATENISTLNVRATEFSVGANGAKAMPAELPANSGYTYCVEFSVDEATLVEAKEIQFSQPVINYVENYLQAQVGSTVPVGYYDRYKGVWIASENGRVIKILNIAGDPPQAEVDTDGDGIADNGMGITDMERQRLATLYTKDQTLWRISINHFTPWDYNWAFGPPSDATFPNQPLQRRKVMNQTRAKRKDRSSNVITRLSARPSISLEHPFGFIIRVDAYPGTSRLTCSKFPSAGLTYL